MLKTTLLVVLAQLVLLATPAVSKDFHHPGKVYKIDTTGDRPTIADGDDVPLAPFVIDGGGDGDDPSTAPTPVDGIDYPGGEDQDIAPTPVDGVDYPGDDQDTIPTPIDGVDYPSGDNYPPQEPAKDDGDDNDGATGDNDYPDDSKDDGNSDDDSTPAASAIEDHEVHDLPGFKGDVPFKHYAGHLPLSGGEKLFYWYAESQNDPATDPVVLWLNGGPGCSSLGGFFTENGPFVVLGDLSVKLNSYSWNRKVNMFWVESPAGVGFSSPRKDADYYNDDVVAERLHEFISVFFAKYSNLQNRQFYITGESYAGIYVPYLVNRLLDLPIEGVNLAGFAIGNPLTDNEIDGNAYMDYYYSHALISRANYHKMLDYCSDEIGQCMYTPVNCSEKCQEAINEGILASDADMFNPYFIYGDICLLSNGQAGSLRFTKKKKNPTATHRGDIGPCTDTFTQSYLRQEEVQSAIHVEGGYVKWTDCNDFVSEYFTRSLSSLPKYKNILASGAELNILIYSGDADSVVNFIGTERWITQEGLNLTIVNAWRAWIGPDSQLGGYVEDYDGLTFKTVKGAGHMVPAVRPLHGLYMFECYIFGEDACNGFKYPRDAYEVEAGYPKALSDYDGDSYDDKPSEGDNGKIPDYQQWLDDSGSEGDDDDDSDAKTSRLQPIKLHATRAHPPVSWTLLMGGVGIMVCAAVAFKLSGHRHRSLFRHSHANERIPLTTSH